MSERQAGWYWVRCCENCRWEVAELHADGEWSVAYPYEVGPRIPTPDEPWTTVPVQPDEAMIDAVFWAWSGTDVRSVYIDMISSAPNPEDS